MQWPGDYVNKLINADCLEVMGQMPDKCVDLVLTDLPYGLAEKMHNGGTWAVNPIYDAMPVWDTTVNDEYLAEILRVSKNQVIWGGHLYRLPISRCWLSWVKYNPCKTMGDFELAWTSFDRPCKKYTSAINPPNQIRSHPTQKPLGLFRWIIKNYTDPNDIIVDPFLGSGTTAIAAHQLGRDFIGIEISPEYCRIAEERLRLERQQLNLFTQRTGQCST